MGKNPNFDPDNLDTISEYATAIGLLTIYWATLENTLLVVIERLMPTDETTARLIGTSLDKAAARATFIQRLVYRPNSSPSPEWADCIAGMCNQISNSLAPKRNRLIHDDWLPRENIITRTNLALKVGKSSAFEAKTLIQNEAAPSHISEIYDLTSRVVSIMVHITMQSLLFTIWKQQGKIPKLPEQAIRASKGLPPDHVAPIVQALQPPPQSSQV
jgi:hypothetical protein